MGTDGNLWFDEWMGRVGRMTPTGSYTEYTMSTSNAEMAGIAAGPDGNVWFTEGGIGTRVGFITMAGVVKELPPLHRIPSGITAGPDGNMWFGCTGAIGAYRLG
jgi:virginiamycin B lyase